MLAFFVALPEPLKLALLSLATLVVGFAFKKLFEAFPWLEMLLGQYVDQVAVALGGALVVLVQNWLNLVPLGWEAVANAALLLVVEILAALGLLLTLQKKFRALR